MVLIRELIARLNAAGVEYVIIDGVAARLHGSPMVTQDLDALIKARAAAGRDKDKTGVMQLEAVRKRKQAPPEAMS
jgi:hypothetical protein